MISFGNILILIVVADFVVWTYNVLFSSTLENGERVHFSIGTLLALLAYYVVHLLVNLFLNYYGGKKNIDKEKRVSIIRLTLFIQFGVGLISIGLLSFSWMNQEQCKNVVIYYIFRFIVIIFMMLLSGDLAATAQVANVNSGGAGAIPPTRSQLHHARQLSGLGGTGPIPLTVSQPNHASQLSGLGGAGSPLAYQPHHAFQYPGFGGAGSTLAFQPRHALQYPGFGGARSIHVLQPQPKQCVGKKTKPKRRGDKSKTK